MLLIVSDIFPLQVYWTDSQKLVRMYFLEGSIHILQFVQIRSKTMLIAAAKHGHLKAWQLNLTVCLLEVASIFFLSNASILVQSHLLAKELPTMHQCHSYWCKKDCLAVLVENHIHLYQEPWDLGALSTPLKTWALATSNAGGKTFYKSPVAIGLHFTVGNDLLILYLGRHWYIICSLWSFWVIFWLGLQSGVCQTAIQCCLQSSTTAACSDVHVWNIWQGNSDGSF